MNSESKLEEKSYFDLAVMLVKHPERAEEIFETKPDFIELMNELRILENIVDIYLSLNNPPTPREEEVFGPLIEMAKEIEINDLSEISIAEPIVEAYLKNVLGYKDWEEYAEERQELLDHLDEMISYGCPPDELRIMCAEHRHRMLFDEETLKEKYAKIGFEYNPRDNSIINVAEQKLQNNPLAKKVFERMDIVEKKLLEITDDSIVGLPLEGKEDEVLYLDDEHGFLVQLLQTIRETDEIKESGNTTLNQERENILSRLVELLGDDLSEEQDNELGELIDQLYDINAQIIRGEGTPLQKRDAELSALEAEANTITAAEALIDRQKQGEQK